MTALVERPGRLPHGPGAGHALRFTAIVVVASPFVRESISRLLRSLGAAAVVEAASLSEARMRGSVSGARDLAIVESDLPDGSGIGLVRELRSLGWHRCVVLAGTEDPYTVRAALAGGVRAFLVSPAAGGRTAGSSRTATVPPRPRGARLAGAEGLSGREAEVLQLVADGHSNKEIGDALGLSALTVKSHLARIARKLGTGDRAEMVVVAMRAGVVV